MTHGRAHHSRRSRHTADYGGSVARLARTAGSRAEVTARLEQFKGVGPKTAEIFLREVPDALIGSG